MPAGYAYKLLQYSEITDGYANPNIFTQSDIITALKINPLSMAQLRTSISSVNVVSNKDGSNVDDSRMKELADSYMGAYDAMEIATSLSQHEENEMSVMINIEDKISSTQD